MKRITGLLMLCASTLAFAGGLSLPSQDNVQANVKLVADLLQQLSKLLKSIPGDSEVAKKLDVVLKPTTKFVDIFSQMDKVMGDVQNAITKARELGKIASCAKASKAAMQKNETCKLVRCVNRPTCVVAGLENLKILLKPLMDDVLLGYEYRGQQKDGLLIQVLAAVDQQDLQSKIKPIIADMKKVTEFINTLETLIKPSIDEAVFKQIKAA